jgi:hypothetical protein
MVRLGFAQSTIPPSLESLKDKENEFKPSNIERLRAPYNPFSVSERLPKSQYDDIEPNRSYMD